MLHSCWKLRRLNNIQPGCKGSDLPACVGDVLCLDSAGKRDLFVMTATICKRVVLRTVIHDSCTALGIECPWQKELDGHLDLVLFVPKLKVKVLKVRPWSPWSHAEVFCYSCYLGHVLWLEFLKLLLVRSKLFY